MGRVRRKLAADRRDARQGEPIPDGSYHIVAEVLVRHVDGDFLLLKRDLNKPAYAGYYEAGTGGSALKGETPEQAALREL